MTRPRWTFALSTDGWCFIVICLVIVAATAVTQCL